MKKKVLMLLLITSMAATSLTACGGKSSEPTGEEKITAESKKPVPEKPVRESFVDSVKEKVEEVVDATFDTAQCYTFAELLRQSSMYSWYFGSSTAEEFVKGLTAQQLKDFADICEQFAGDIEGLQGDAETYGRPKFQLDGEVLADFIDKSVKDVISEFQDSQTRGAYSLNNEVVVIVELPTYESISLVVNATGVLATEEYTDILDMNTDWVIKYAEKDNVNDESEFLQAVNRFFADYFEYKESERISAAIENNVNYSQEEQEEGSEQWWKNKSIESFYRYDSTSQTDAELEYFQQYSHVQVNDIFLPDTSYVGQTADFIAEADGMINVVGSYNDYEAEGILFNKDAIVYYVVPAVKGQIPAGATITYAEKMVLDKSSFAEWLKSAPEIVDSVYQIEKGKALIRISFNYEYDLYVVINYPTNFNEGVEYLDQMNLLSRFFHDTMLLGDDYRNYMQLWSPLVDKLMERSEIDFIYDDYVRWTDDAAYDSYQPGMQGYEGNYRITDFHTLKSPR